jgi:hypothetical protein
MKKLGPLAALLTAALAGAAVATGFGGGSSAPIKQAAESSYTLPTHRVAAPSTAGKAPAKVRRAKVRYFETKAFNLPRGETDGTTGQCPRRFKALNGYFGDNTGDVVAIFNSVGTTQRRWSIAVRNLDIEGKSARVFLGIICLKP